MAIHLDDYQELLDELPGAAQDLLRASWNEAARVFTPRGLDNYLKGASALHQLGRGEQLVVGYLQAMPEMARAIGEEALPDLVGFLLRMASKTSGQVLALIAETAPLAARRLGDAELFSQYLKVLEIVLAQAPRGLRPMLENLDRLLGQLTLGGLRRWVQWGAQAYQADFDGQAEYFGLRSADSLAVLQQERKGTLLVDIQRRLNMYLRAMWGRDFFLRPTAGDYESREGLRPYIEHYVIHLADAYDDYVPPAGQARAGEPIPGLEIYRAAANHCAAHLVFTREPLSMQGLTPLQMAVIEVFEDARVEALAIRQFPNMRAAWLALHPQFDFSQPPATVGELLDRLARALLEEASTDPHPWVRSAVAAFRAQEDLSSNRLSWNLGVEFAHGIGEMGLPEFNRRTDRGSALYRDDNRAVWQLAQYDEAQALQATWEARQQVRRKASVMEMINEVDVEFAGDDAQEVWVLPTEYYLDDGTTINELEGRPPISDPFRYPEWDYQIQLARPDWVTVLERHPPVGDLGAIEQIIVQHKPVMARLKYLIESMVPQGMQRIRRVEDGDDIDLNAAVQSMVDVRLRRQPDARIMVRLRRRSRDLAALLLLDVSESSNEKVRGADYTVLDLTRAATVLLAGALDRIGDPFAIHTFCSDGRHDVHYERLKDFDEPWGDRVKARLAAIAGRLSTRMGAALRHAGSCLARQPKRRRVLFIVTDGEPADNDVRDPQYLRHDARHAVEELARQGITVYALSLDAHADEYVSRIFGPKHYTVIDRVERLPERLPALYLSLTR